MSSKRMVTADLGHGNFMVGRLLAVFQDLEGKTRAVVQEEKSKLITVCYWQNVEAFEKRLLIFKHSKY